MLRAAIWLLACALVLTPLLANAEDQPGAFADAADIADHTTDICAAVVFDGRSYEDAFGDARWISVNPRPISNLATRAWRIATFNDTYLMSLPNGCSFGVEDGDGQALRAHIVERLSARAAFELISDEPARDGGATRYAYCTAGPHPYVASMVVGEGRSRPHLVFNLFRASTAAPEFCNRAAPAPG